MYKLSYCPSEGNKPRKRQNLSNNSNPPTNYTAQFLYKVDKKALWYHYQKCWLKRWFDKTLSQISRFRQCICHQVSILVYMNKGLTSKTRKKETNLNHHLLELKHHKALKKLQNYLTVLIKPILKTKSRKPTHLDIVAMTMAFLITFHSSSHVETSLTNLTKYRKTNFLWIPNNPFHDTCTNRKIHIFSYLIAADKV